MSEQSPATSGPSCVGSAGRALRSGRQGPVLRQEASVGTWAHPSCVGTLTQTDPAGERCWNCLCQTVLCSGGRTWEQVAFPCLPAETSILQQGT